MDETLEKLYSKLSLNPEESTPIEFSANLHDELPNSFSLVGKILVPRIINPRDIENMFRKLWQPRATAMQNTGG